jgi:hypothetical protein
MKKPKLKRHPEAKKFILEIINTESGFKTLAGKSFADIVKHANSKGYDISDVDLLSTLNHYYKNDFPLPHWIASKLGELGNWVGWEKGRG